MSGYVLLHRALLGHPAFRNDAEALAFAWLFAKATWKPTRVRYKGHSLTLKRGQVAVSQRDMAAALDRDKAWVERLWNRLKSEAMIETTTEAGVAVLTICNYDEYQAFGDDGEAPGEAVVRQGSSKIRGDFEPSGEAGCEAAQQSANHYNSSGNREFAERREAAGEARGEAVHEAGVRQRRGTEQLKEEDKKKTAREALADDWQPKPFGEGTESRKIVGNWSAQELARQLEAFRAHHIGHKTKWADWQKAWSTWVLNSVKFARPERFNGRSERRDDLDVIYDDLVAQGKIKPAAAHGTAR